MVSKASDDLPEPDKPVMTTRLLRGMSTSMFLRLWTRAPRTAIQSWDIWTGSGLTAHGAKFRESQTGHVRSGLDQRKKNGGGLFARRPPQPTTKRAKPYLRCLLTSFVISNMLTSAFPKT